MSKLVQNQYYYNSKDSQTCLKLFRFNMIRIVAIHMILLNMSKLVQNQYCYDSNYSQTLSKWHEEIYTDTDTD